MRRRRFVTMLALAGVAGCKPATPEEAFRRALAGHDAAKVAAALDAGRDLEHTFDDGSKPIHIVAKSPGGTAQVMRLLLERGAKVDATDGDGKTAWDLRWGKRGGDAELSEDDASVLLALLDHGFSPPLIESEKGRTLLHDVARRCHSARLVTVLVETHGLDVHARDDDGWTPLHHAAAVNNPEAATGLLMAGANVNAETTEVVGSSYDRAGTQIWRWRYDAGSRPMDLFSYAKKGRFDGDVRKILEQHGGTSNPAVDNKPR